MSDYLNEDLIFEIFTRLPSKSLIRFRSLSKSLSSLIASPDFIRMHTFRSPQKILIEHMPDESDIADFYTLHSKDQLPTRRRQYIGIQRLQPPCNIYTMCVGSCNGIICLIDYDIGISLWNPSIRRKLTLPDFFRRCSSRCPRGGCCRAHWVWTESDYQPIGIGFGFDSITDDFKIVCLPECGENGESSYVYTMKTGAWCAISSPPYSFSEVTSCGCFVNGALHWVVVVDSRSYILTFDLSTHVFGMMALPRSRWESKQLTVFQGSLAVIYSNDDYSRMWVRREYNNKASWSVVFKSVSFKRKRNQVSRELRGVLSNSDLLLFHTEEDYRFQLYDPKVGGKTRLRNIDVHSFIVHVETYVESLHLSDMGTACQPSLLEEKKRKRRSKKN